MIHILLLMIYLIILQTILINNKNFKMKYLEFPLYHKIKKSLYRSSIMVLDF